MKEEGRKKIKKENTKVKLMKFQISIFFARRKAKFYFTFILSPFSILVAHNTKGKHNLVFFDTITNSDITRYIPSNIAILEFSLRKWFWRNTGVITTRINALSVENSARIRGFK